MPPFFRLNLNWFPMHRFGPLSWTPLSRVTPMPFILLSAIWVRMPLPKPVQGCLWTGIFGCECRWIPFNLILYVEFFSKNAALCNIWWNPQDNRSRTNAEYLQQDPTVKTRFFGKMSRLYLVSLVYSKYESAPSRGNDTWHCQYRTSE